MPDLTEFISISLTPLSSLKIDYSTSLQKKIKKLHKIILYKKKNCIFVKK